jgi:Ca2+-binding EF-hand superfamily protein
MGYFQLYFGQFVDQTIACNGVLSVPANPFISYKRKKVKDLLLSQAIDKDGSGFIDAGELGRMGGKMDGDKARALMTKLDKDGDGKINLQEFRTLFKQ